MRGHVRKRGKKWAIVLYIGYDQVGKKKYKWFSGYGTKKEAERDLAVRVNEIHSGMFLEPSRDSFEVFLGKWLEYKSTQVRQRTVEIYQRTIRLHIAPNIGKIPLDELKPYHLREFYLKLSKMESPISNRYISQIHTLIHDALTRAVKWELVHRNVADFVDAPKPEKKKFAVWSLEDAHRFLDAEEVKNHRFYTAFLLALTTGMRQGEILGLQWSDINWEENSLTVNRTLTYINGGHTFGDPKSESGHRKISLPLEVMEALRRHKAKQNEERLLLGELYHGLDLVVARSNGNIVDQTFLRKRFVDLMEKLDMPYIRFHDLRHTHASILLELGEQTKVLQERLGHSDYSTTMDIYTHVSRRLQDNTARLLSTGLLS